MDSASPCYAFLPFTIVVIIIVQGRFINIFKIHKTYITSVQFAKEWKWKKILPITKYSKHYYINLKLILYHTPPSGKTWPWVLKCRRNKYHIFHAPIQGRSERGMWDFRWWQALAQNWSNGWLLGCSGSFDKGSNWWSFSSETCRWTLYRWWQEPGTIKESNDNGGIAAAKMKSCSPLTGVKLINQPSLYNFISFFLATTEWRVFFFFQM